MGTIEERLHELANQASSDPARSFDVDELRTRALGRRRNRRLMVSAGLCGVALVALAVVVSVVDGRGPQRLDTIDGAPAPSTTLAENTAETDPTGDESSASEEATGSDASGDEPSEPVPPQFELSSEHAGRAMDAVDRFLTALSVGDHLTAAVLWNPDPDLVDGPPDGLEAKAAALEARCGPDGCADGYVIFGARGASDGEDEQRLRAEVFLADMADPDTPFTVWVEADSPTAPETEWRVRSEPWTREFLDSSLVDILFPDVLPQRLTVVRPDGIDALIDGTLVRTDPGTPIDTWIRSGWVHSEGQWINATDPTRTCDYSSWPGPDEPGVVPIDIFNLDGRWITEVLPGGGGIPTELSVFVDCETGTVDESLNEFGSRYAGFGGADQRLFSADGRWVSFLADESSCCGDVNHRVVTPDGDEIALVEPAGGSGFARADQPRYHGGSETIAYLSVTSPSNTPGSPDERSAIEVRSVTTGDVLHQVEVPAIGTLSFDGRFVAYSYGDRTVGPLDGTIHTPGGRVVILDVETGEVRTITSWSASVSID